MSRQAAQPDFQGNSDRTGRIYWVAGLISMGLAFIALPLDSILAQPDNLQELPGDLKRFVHLSEIFAHGFGILIVGVGVWLLASDKRRFIPRIVLCAAWPSVGVLLIKALVGRYRPIKYLNEESHANFPDNITDTFLGWLPDDRMNVVYVAQSFPSAHTATVWGLAIGMAWVFPKGRWLFFSIAVLASIQRVTSFAHWPSDVLFGAGIGVIMAGAITQNWGLGYYLGQFENRRAAKLKIAEAKERNPRKAA
jgi:membrane-associated phospholipid phosphatase